jgi:hypothetical protein
MGNGTASSSSSSPVLRTEMQDALAECKGYAAPRGYVRSAHTSPCPGIGCKALRSARQLQLARL